MSEKFNQRYEQGEIAVQRFISWLDWRGLEYAYTGQEKLQCSWRFAIELQNRDDIVTKLIRYMPDLLVLGHETGYVEIKHGKTIGRDCYESSMLLVELGFCVSLVILYDDNLYSMKMQELQLQEQIYKETIDGVDYNIYGLPYSDKYWIEKWKLPTDKWKDDDGGFPYAYVDFEKSNAKILQTKEESNEST